MVCAANRTGFLFMESLTAPQVLALAPDPASAKAGRGLGNPARWSALGREGQAIWGECQGSALYRTQVDLTGPAFHCSCPSRKFPCKHGLGLLLVLADHPARFAEATPPVRVAEWLKRRDAAEKKAVPRAEAAGANLETVARQSADKQKRAARRGDRVQAGLAELQTWLGDLLRQGLVKAREQPTKFYDSIAARMVDAQAPGLARRLREWPGLLASGEDWADRMLAEAGTLQWLLNGGMRVDTLPDGLRASVRAAIGWTITEQELLADGSAERINDRWQVVGRRVEEEGKLRVQRTWLVGEATGRLALCLSFAAGPQQALDVGLVPGTIAEGELVFYPSAAPLRALAVAPENTATPFAEPAACAHFGNALERTAGWLAGDPWQERLPWLVRGCLPVQTGADWSLRDGQGAIVPLAKVFAHVWPLVAASGGQPVTVFGEWDGRALLPLSAFAEGRFLSLEDVAA